MTTDRAAFGAYVVVTDQGTTLRAYREYKSEAEKCGCAYCRNFIAARHQVFPPSVVDLFEKLGINPACEAEVYHMYMLRPGLHSYGGWFHFVGRIEGQPQDSWEEVGEGFRLWFHTNLALVRPSLEGYPLVQLEFEAEVPWVLGESESA